MIGQIQRMRPTYSMDQLLLHKETGELSYAPDEFAPHTATAYLRSADTVELIFEYSIDENRGLTHSPDVGTKIVLSRYTFKVQSVSIQFRSLPDLLSRLTLVQSWLDARSNLLPKDSYKKNYQFAKAILDEFMETLEQNPSVLGDSLARE